MPQHAHEKRVYLPSTDPDVRRYDRDDLPVCPECHSYMLPLATYETPKGGAEASVEDDFVESMFWGIWAPVYNFFYDLFTYPGRWRQTEKVKQEVLPAFPNSVICPRCLHLIRRA